MGTSNRLNTVLNNWLATLQAISDPYSQTACLWLSASLCMLSVRSTACAIDNVRATLRSLQSREPRRLTACSLCFIMQPSYRTHYASCPSVYPSVGPARASNLKAKKNVKKSKLARTMVSIFSLRGQWSRSPDVNNLRKTTHISSNHGYDLTYVRR